MTDTEIELRRILDTYIKLSDDSWKKALMAYKEAITKTLDEYKKLKDEKL